MSLNLVYDRTEEDETSAAAIRSAYQKLGNWSGLTDAERAQLERGALTYNTLNRVEQAVKTLAAALTSAGYPVEVTPVLKGASRLPTGYTEVEYIESSGTQYIDTGVPAKDITDSFIDFRFKSVGTTELEVMASYVDGNNRLQCGWTGSAFKTGTGATYSQTTDSTARTTATCVPVGSPTSTVYLFAQNQSDAPKWQCKAEIYECTMSTAAGKVRDFIPCKNPSGAVGLYDLVEGKFYTTPTAATLPAGYTQVERLKSTGVQYINVGFKPNQDTRIVLDVNSPLVSGPVWLFGARTAVDRKTYNFLCQGSKYRSDYNDNSSTSLTINPSGRFTIDKDKNVTKINGSTASTITYGAFQCEYNLFLFSNNNAGAANSGASISIYSCKIYDNGVLVRDMVPARNSSGTLGMYDLVGGTFYTNAGSGTFTAGADIVGFTSGAEIGTVEDREWQEGDVLYRPQWTTYLDNVQKLRDAYYTLAETGELPEPGDKLGYEGANTIEKVLADIDLLLDGMKSSYRRCGAFRAGNNAAHLPLKGSI